MSLFCGVAFDNHIQPRTSNNTYFYAPINPLFETKWVANVMNLNDQQEWIITDALQNIVSDEF